MNRQNVEVSRGITIRRILVHKFNALLQSKSELVKVCNTSGQYHCQMLRNRVLIGAYYNKRQKSNNTVHIYYVAYPGSLLRCLLINSTEHKTILILT